MGIWVCQSSSADLSGNFARNTDYVRLIKIREFAVFENWNGDNVEE